jgi:hypothetical protein
MFSSSLKLHNFWDTYSRYKICIITIIAITIKYLLTLDSTYAIVNHKLSILEQI